MPFAEGLSGGTRLRKNANIMRNHQYVSRNGADLLRPLVDLTDEELMAQLATGDEEALLSLHARYAGLVFGIVAQSLDRPAAEEITQDVFFTIWQKAQTYDLNRGQVRPWLLQIARSRMLNEVRRRGRRPQLASDQEATDLSSLADRSPLPDEEVDRDDRRTMVMEAIAALPPTQRQALSLAFFDDLTQQQVATQLGVPLGTAKTWIRMGMRQLRSTLPPPATYFTSRRCCSATTMP